MEDIYYYLQSELMNNGYKEKTEIYTKNTVYQISTIEEQKNNKNTNISIIDFGECEYKLKNVYKIPENKELIVLKLDIKYEDSTYVQYEVYNPIDTTKLNLTVCENLQILIDVPVILNFEVHNLHKSLEKSGYNLFNLNDSFYNDICSIYTTENDTDITLKDRKNIFYSKIANLSFCQTGCTFQAYNSTTQRVKCNCEANIKNIKTMLTNLTFVSNQIINTFYVTIKNSNFKVLKCYKLLYDIDNLKNNIGCIIMTIIYFLLFIFLIVFCFTNRKKIDYFIKLILFYKKKSEKINIINNKKSKIKKKNSRNFKISKKKEI